MSHSSGNKCVDCGAVAQASAVFCVSCGTAIDNSRYESAAITKSPTNTTADVHRLVPGQGETGKHSRIWDPAAAASEFPKTIDPACRDSGTVIIESPSKRADFESLIGPDGVAVDAQLLFSDGSRIRVILRSQSERFTLGRDKSLCDAAVKDYLVSRVHTAIGTANNTTYVEDLGSTNGTYVNGHQIEGICELSDGDRIRIGHTDIVFRLS